MTWEQLEAIGLQKLGLNPEQVTAVLLRIAEHRRLAEDEGWSKGQVVGYDYGKLVGRDQLKREMAAAAFEKTNSSQQGNNVKR